MDTPGQPHRPRRPASDTASSTVAVGSELSGYRIERVLSVSDTATVYLAKNPALPRHDALKVLDANLSLDPLFRRRFIREADIASLLEHPNIVSIHNRGEAHTGQLWIAMAFVAGTDAEEALRVGAMTAPRALRIVGEIAKALDHAHRHNVVHHDVKPGNVLLGNGDGPVDDYVVLSDFGVAQVASRDGVDDGDTLAATLAYAAPEVILGHAADGRSDIYSLACTLFRLLTGTHPFHGAEGTTAVALAHLHQAPRRISECLPRANDHLDAVVARALAKNPDDRFRSARDFAAAAASALAGTSVGHLAPIRHTPAPNRRPVTTIQPERFYRDAIRITPTPARRRRRPAAWTPLLVGGAGITAVVVVAVGAVLLWPSHPSGGADLGSAAAPSAPAPSPALTRLLPHGYPSGACTAASTDAGTAAAMTCGPNVDADGPTSATYVLSQDLPALRAALADTVNRSVTVNCPFDTQSPGPWRRADSPDVERGVLFCGTRAGQPLVAWTNAEELRVSVVRAETPGATLESLYAWWSSHS